ncbi:MAG: FtsX-like permease family protein [Acidobacteriota bacterium]
MKTLALLAPLAWRNLWRNRKRTLILVMAVAVGVASMVLVSAILNAWNDSMLHSALITLTGDGQVHASESLPVTLVGIAPKSETGLSFIADAAKRGRGLSGSDDTGILLGRRRAERLQTGLGKRIVLMSKKLNGGMAERGYRVVGVYAGPSRAAEMRYVFVGLGQAQSLLGLGPQVSEISFMIKDRASLSAFLGRLQTAAPGLNVQGWKTLIPFTRALLKMSGGFVQLWTVVMFIAMAFGLVNVLLMAVMERTRELGLLQALGLRPSGLLVEVLLESFVLVGLGVAAGTALGGGLVLAFHHGIHLGSLSAGAEWFGGGRTLYPRVSWREMVFTGLFVWCMGTLVTLYPAWRAARSEPTDVMARD